MKQDFRRPPPQLDMTLDGRFRTPRQISPAAVRVGVAALLVALVAGGLAAAAFALWIVTLLLPVAVVAGLVAYGAFRFQIWRLRREGVAGRGPFPPPRA